MNNVVYVRCVTVVCAIYKKKAYSDVTIIVQFRALLRGSIDIL